MNQPERSGDRLESDLHRGQIRGLLLQKRERPPDRVDSDRATRRGCGTPRSFDLEQGSHGAGNRFGNRHELLRDIRVGLNCTERTSQCFTS